MADGLIAAADHSLHAAGAALQRARGSSVDAARRLGDLGLEDAQHELNEQMLAECARALEAAEGEAGDPKKYAAVVKQMETRWRVFLALRGSEDPVEPTVDLAKEFAAFMINQRQRPSSTGRQGLGDSTARIAQFVLAQVRRRTRNAGQLGGAWVPVDRMLEMQPALESMAWMQASLLKYLDSGALSDVRLTSLQRRNAEARKERLQRAAEQKKALLAKLAAKAEAAEAAPPVDDADMASGASWLPEYPTTEDDISEADESPVITYRGFEACMTYHGYEAFKRQCFGCYEWFERAEVRRIFAGASSNESCKPGSYYVCETCDEKRGRPRCIVFEW